MASTWPTPADPHRIALLFLLSILLQNQVICRLRLTSGSVWPCVAYHAVWNAVIQAALDPATDGSHAWFLVGEQGVILLAVNLAGALLLSTSQGAADGLWAPASEKSVPNVSKVLSGYATTGGLGAYMVMDAMGLISNKKVIRTPPTSWTDLFDSAYRGRVTTWDAPAFSVNAVPVINQIEGGSDGDLSKGIAAFSQAAKKGQFSGLISSVDQLRQQLNSGQVVIAPGFQGVAQPWIDEGDPIGFAVPKQGVMVFPEGFQLVKGSSDEQLGLAADLMDEIFAPDAVSDYSAATATIPLVQGAELPAT
ncbi:extracellular solute-binding protein [Streptomyces sp. MMS24-I2-30]|uniref:extracellular solute-binding protein n=1 Tax=Streptomyces sp. MMS24-I2-30 TaxID=3351564 RepID=UPI003896AF66